MDSLGISFCPLTTMCALGRGRHEVSHNPRVHRGLQDHEHAVHSTASLWEDATVPTECHTNKSGS